MPKPPSKTHLVQQALEQLYTEDPGSFQRRWMKVDNILSCLKAKFPFDDDYNCDRKAALSVVPK